MAIKLNPLSSRMPIVDPQGLPTSQFARFWQSSIGKIIEAVNAVSAAQAAADAANAAAATATAAADTATAAAAATDAATSLTNSYVTGLTLTATDAGANVTVTISAHTRVYGDGTSVSVSGSSIPALAYSTDYYFYYDQPSRAGGAVTYVATTSTTNAAQTGDRHLVGTVTTPAVAGAPATGRGLLPLRVADFEP